MCRGDIECSFVAVPERLREHIIADKTVGLATASLWRLLDTADFHEGLDTLRTQELGTRRWFGPISLARSLQIYKAVKFLVKSEGADPFKKVPSTGRTAIQLLEARDRYPYNPRESDGTRMYSSTQSHVDDAHLMLTARRRRRNTNTVSLLELVKFICLDYTYNHMYHPIILAHKDYIRYILDYIRLY